jgi:hypothetical protein
VQPLSRRIDWNQFFETLIPSWNSAMNADDAQKDLFLGSVINQECQNPVPKFRRIAYIPNKCQVDTPKWTLEVPSVHASLNQPEDADWRRCSLFGLVSNL